MLNAPAQQIIREGFGVAEWKLFPNYGPLFTFHIVFRNRDMTLRIRCRNNVEPLASY